MTQSTKFTNKGKAADTAAKAPKPSTKSPTRAARNAAANEPVDPPVDNKAALGDDEVAGEAPATGGPISQADIDASRNAIDDQAIKDAQEQQAAQAAVEVQPQPGLMYAGATVEKTVYLVTIKRGLEEIPTEVLPHEVAILKQLHLPENVKIVDKAFGVVDLPDSASIERLRLLSKYGVKGRDAVERLYPTIGVVAREVGLDNDEDREFGAPESFQQDNRRKPKAKA